MNTWIYGIIIGIIIGFIIARYTDAPVSEGFQTTANDPIPGMNTESSCAAIDTLSKAFISRMESNPAFKLDTGTSEEIASRKDSLNKLIENHRTAIQQQKAKIGCS